MNTLGLILLFTFIGGTLSLLSVAFALRSEIWIRRSSVYFASFAAGVLLAISFFDLLPEAVHHAEEKGWEHTTIFYITAAGFLLFFLIERVFHWHHYHEGHLDTENKTPPYRYLIMIGDILHNLLDGVAIAVTFLASPALGIATAISIFFHEIPKEIGDISLLIRSGMSRWRAIIFNFISKVTNFIGAITAYFFAESMSGSLAPFFAIAAGAFLYIAATDLIPEIQEETKRRRIVAQVCLLFLGVAIMWILGQLLPHAE